MKKILIAFGAAFTVLLGSALAASAASVFLTTQGGTGTSTPSGILYGDNGSTTHLNTVKIGSNLSFTSGTLSATAGGTVTSVSVASANGLAGTSSGGGTPALTLRTTITGVLKGNGTAISAATAGTDYVTGSGTSGNCVKWGATNSLADFGGPCPAQLPTYLVKASGGDFTTIQAAVTACAARGGGNIYLLDATYSLGGTGVTWRGDNCHIIGRGVGTTTIAFTGATTAFKTNSAAGQYSNNSINGVTISGDGNASGIALDISDMSHNVYSDIQVDNVGTLIRGNDTQNITFYNEVHNVQGTTLKAFGINASSTNPFNANRFENVFIGCNANCVSVQMNNGNNNYFESVQMEPSTVTGTVGVKLFDNHLATNDGVFDNVFTNSYIEANGTGISIAATVEPTHGGVQRNLFQGGIVDANTTDLSVADYSKNTFVSLDNNFGNAVNNFQAPFTINGGIRNELFSIVDTGFSSQALLVRNNVNFAHTNLDFNKFSLLNASDASNLLNLSNLGTGATLIATSTRGTDFILRGSNGFVGVGTSTPAVRLHVSGGTSATTTVEFDARSSTSRSCINLRSNTGGAVSIYVIGTTLKIEANACR